MLTQISNSFKLWLIYSIIISALIKVITNPSNTYGSGMVMATDGQSKRIALATSNLGPDPSASTPALFAYGSLLLDSVIIALIDRVPEYEVTTAQGHRVAQLPGQPYPGLVRDESAQAPGRI